MIILIFDTFVRLAICALCKVQCLYVNDSVHITKLYFFNKDQTGFLHRMTRASRVWLGSHTSSDPSSSYLIWRNQTAAWEMAELRAAPCCATDAHYFPSEYPLSSSFALTLVAARRGVSFSGSNQVRAALWCLDGQPKSDSGSFAIPKQRKGASFQRSLALVHTTAWKWDYVYFSIDVWIPGSCLFRWNVWIYLSI